MFVFKEYSTSKTHTFETKLDFFAYLDSICDSEDIQNQNGGKYLKKFENDDDEYITYDGFIFKGFSLGWDKEQQRFKLLGYWKQYGCKDT